MSIVALPVKTLVKVLAHLRGGEIGFDPFRDPRTSKKENLLSFMLAEHSNDQIATAVQAVVAAEQSAAIARAVARYTRSDEKSDSQSAEVALHYVDMSGTLHSKTFPNEAAKHVWLLKNPSMRGVSSPQDSMPPPPKPQQSTTLPAVSDEASQLAALLAKLAGKGTVDEETVKRIVQRQFEDENASISAHYTKLTKEFEMRAIPTVVHVVNPSTAETQDLGHQHHNFTTLLKMAQARTRDGHRLNVWIKGPAGSGKTTAAHKVAQALSLPFHFNGAISTEYELMGFKDASGFYHKTAFRDAYEHGGVYLFDEIDSSLPKAVLAFNAALANGQCRFPDAQIARHKDCVILAGANTSGTGATSDYVGRMKQDLAFLNRFVLIDWPLDATLETALASNKPWVAKVQKFRKLAEKRGIKGHIISPRATFYGEALLAAGIDEDTVMLATLKGGLSADAWESLCQ